jgi:hypothetical protein
MVSWLAHYSFVELEDRIFAEAKLRILIDLRVVELGLLARK